MDAEDKFGNTSRPRSRSRSLSRGKGKSYRNPYLNFLRDFRKQLSSSIDPREVLIRAGKVWRELPAEEKQIYIMEATQTSSDSPRKKSQKTTKGSNNKKKNTKNSKKNKSRRSTEESDDASNSSYNSDSSYDDESDT